MPPHVPEPVQRAGHSQRGGGIGLRQPVERGAYIVQILLEQPKPVPQGRQVSCFCPAPFRPSGEIRCMPVSQSGLLTACRVLLQAVLPDRLEPGIAGPVDGNAHVRQEKALGDKRAMSFERFEELAYCSRSSWLG